MVLDCGGGTVDITIHKLSCNPDERFLCEELLPSSGGCQWGSKFVDKHFEDFSRDTIWLRVLLSLQSERNGTIKHPQTFRNDEAKVQPRP